jgi:Tfp pilus assembly protein FimT
MLRVKEIITETRGISILEFLIVMAVVAILGAFASPYFMANRVVAATRTMHGDLQYARMLAINQKHDVRVVFTVLDESSETVPGQYQIHEDTNKNGNVDDGEETTIRDLTDDYKGVTFSANQGAATFCCGGTANSGTVTLTDGCDTRYVIFTWTGRVRIGDSPPS